MSFMEWIEEFIDQGKKIGYFDEKTTCYWETGKIVTEGSTTWTHVNDWKYYWEDGFTPEEALNDELSYL